jgi:hypothetical protein
MKVESLWRLGLLLAVALVVSWQLLRRRAHALRNGRTDRPICGMPT